MEKVNLEIKKNDTRKNDTSEDLQFKIQSPVIQKFQFKTLIKKLA